MNIEEQIQKMQKLSNTFATLESQRVNLIEQLIEYTKENLGKEECKLEGNKIKSEVDQIDEKREKIMKKIWSTSNRLMKTYFIDSAQMCKLLNAKHSGRWQVMPITGDFAEDWSDYGQSTSYVNFLCYGLTLLHTNNIH